MLNNAQQAAICAERLRDVIACLDAMFENLPRGFMDADLIITTHDITYRWPALNPTIQLNAFSFTAHERLHFAAGKQQLAVVLRAFHDSCRKHPALGAHLNHQPEERLRLRWKEGNVAIDFATFYNGMFPFPWKPLNTACDLLANLVRPPRFTKTVRVFTQEQEKNFLGGSNITHRSFLDIAPFLTEELPETIATWVMATPKALHSSPYLLAFNLNKGISVRLSDHEYPDEEDRLEFLIATRKSAIAVPHARSQELLEKSFKKDLDIEKIFERP